MRTDLQRCGRCATGRCSVLSDEHRPQRLDDILQEFLGRRSGLRRQLRRREVFTRWRDIVGDNLSRKLVPIRVRNRILFVRASSSSWAQEVGMMKHRILQNIRRSVGPGIIDDLRVQVGFSGGPGEETNNAGLDAGKDGDETGDDEVPPAPLSPSGGEDEDMDLAERVRRLRRADEYIKRWRRQRGWPKCVVCGERHPPDTGEKYCPICLRERANRYRESVRRFLEEAPWMSVKQLRRETGAPQEVCRRVRNEVAHFWQSRISEGVRRAEEGGGDPPEDFTRRVLQVVSLRAGVRNPTLDRSAVKKACGRAAADLFFAES